jgi:hypothetical protein
LIRLEDCGFSGAIYLPLMLVLRLWLLALFVSVLLVVQSEAMT